MNDKIGDERRGSRQDGIFLLRLTNDHQIGQRRVRSQRLSCGTLDAAPFPLNAFLRQAALDQLAIFIFRIANRLQRFGRNIACTIRITDKNIGIPACGLQTDEEALVISHEIDRRSQAAVLSGVAIDVQQHCFHLSHSLPVTLRASASRPALRWRDAYQATLGRCLAFAPAGPDPKGRRKPARLTLFGGAFHYLIAAM